MGLTDKPAFTTRTLGENVVTSLREAIVTRQIPAGARLVDSDIASYINVSRGTVREALRTLTHEGIVVSKPNRGYFVADPEPEQVIELLELRAMLEAKAAAASVSYVTDEDIERLTAIAEEIESKVYRDDVLRIRHLDVEFHSIATQHCRKPILLELWSSLNTRLCMLDVLCADILQMTAAESAERHYRYINALRSGCPDQASTAASEHYLELVRRYELRLSGSG